jgi:DNA-binding NarL/FixJ family response regulator
MPSSDSTAPLEHRPPPRILVIEDEPVIRSCLELMLRREGYEVTATENGRQGLDSALASPPDLILCDSTMPLLDGRSVLRAVRADPRTRAVQFIFLSGMNTPADHRSGMNLGADDYLSKPFSSSDLMAAVRSRLERAAAHAEARTAPPAPAPREMARPGTGFRPDYQSALPLEVLGVSPREAEVLLWVAQGKSNAEIAAILGLSEFTVKRHMAAIFGKLGVDSRNAASVMALAVLSAPPE